MAREHGFFNPDPLQICPLNPAHTVLKSRMQSHLVRCKLTGMPDKLTGKSSCPYNATHIIDEEVMAHHMETCPDRRTVDVFKYKVGNKARTIDILPVENRDIPCEENWDDIDVPTYEPIKRLEEDGSLLVHLKGAPPAERKQFREERRQLYQTHSVKQEEYGTDGPVYSYSRSSPTPDRKYENLTEECGSEPFEYNKKKKPSGVLGQSKNEPGVSRSGFGRGGWNWDS